ncbi:MAG: DUF6165 family protein [Alphaproteobacteria bacterium]
MTAEISVPVAPGELLDKITILELKMERIRDLQKLRNVRTEMALLRAIVSREIPDTAEIAKLTAELRGINAELWDIEDKIRDCERAGDFGATFVALARAVYRNNDRRAGVKRRINLALGSTIVEEKSYAASE